jgi:hypothetical protein
LRARRPILFRCGAFCHETAAIVLVQLLVIAAGLWYVFHDPQKRAQIVEALRDGGLCWVIIGYHPSAWGLVGAAVS